MKSDRIPHNDFSEGFIVGYQTVRGTTAGIPGTPGTPGTPGNLTPFLMGVRAGLRAAGVNIT